GHRRAHPSGRHEVHAHLRRQLDGDGHHHRLQRAFRRGVVRVAGLATLSGRAADEDDVLQAGGKQIAHQVERREHVDAKHLLERRRLDPGDRAPVVDAGRVHEQVHLAELLAGGADGINAPLLGAEIGVLTPAQVNREAIWWDTLALLLGMMVITSVMARAGIFRWIAWVALRRAHGPRALLAVLVLVAGTLSALLVNDTVCVMCTP